MIADSAWTRRRRRGFAVSMLLVLSAFAYLFAAVSATIVKTNAGARNTVARYQDVVNANSLGDPLSGSSSCMPGRPMRQTYVCDASALLAPRSANRIDAELQSIYSAQGKYKRALCNGRQMSYGYLIEVAVVRRMDSGRNSAPSFASTLYQNWRVGDSQATCGNGVLILISMEDRKYYFATGSSVRNIIGTHSSNRVERALVKYLKRNNVYMAVLNAVMVLGKELAKNTHGGSSGYSPPAYVPPTNDYGPSSTGNRNEEETKSPWAYIMFGIMSLLGASLCFAACNGVGGKEAALRKKQARVVTRKLATIKEEYEMAALPQYIPMSCSVSSESLSPKVPSVTDEEADENDPLVDKYRGPVCRLRCGHAFFEWNLEKHVPSLEDPVCPVCSDSATALGSPPTLLESRDRDLAFRLANLRDEYPNIITDRIHQQLLNGGGTRTGRTGGVLPPGADDANYRENDRTSGPAWGTLAGAAGVGALTAWGLGSIFGGRNDNRYDNNYQNGNGNSNWGTFEDWTGGWGSGNDSSGANNGGNWGSGTGGNWGSSGGGNWGGGWGSGGGGGWGSGGGGGWGGGGGGDNSGFGGGW